MDDIDQQSNDGLYCIYRKVTFNVRNARFCPFSHNYKYYAIAMKCCPNLYNHVDALENKSCPTYEICGITIKVIIKVRKV